MDYYNYPFEERFKKNKAEKLGEIDLEFIPDRRKTPANIDEKPSGGRKVIPFNDKSKKAKIETRSPRDFSPKVPVNKLFGNPIFNFLFNPTQTAAPYEDEYNWKDYGSDISNMIAENNFVGRDLATSKLPLKDYEVELPTLPAVDPNFIRPEVTTVEWKNRPGDRPFISTSPKIGTVEYGVPDYDVPPPFPIELPDSHPWFDEPPAHEVPDLVREFDFETQPMYDPLSPKTVRRPDSIKETGVSIEISSGVVPTVKIRPQTVKGATKRRNDTKAASKWIKLSQLAISLTYGTYTEVMDFVEILVWDAYYVDPKTGKLRYAMFEEDYKIVNVLNGIAEGKYSLDIAATLVDYGVSQAQDILIGQASRMVTKQVIDTGNWRSPQGPQGFINKMQKDFQNVLSQYETFQSNETQRRLFSLPDIRESPRKLWNTKSGLSP